MASGLLFRADHPATVFWSGPNGEPVTRRGRLHRITQTQLAVMLPRSLTRDEQPRRDQEIRVELADYRGLHLLVYRGPVKAVEARIISIHLGGEAEHVQRRRFVRAPVRFRFAAARLIGARPRHFLAQPLDIGQGGIRFRHRLPLAPDDTVRFNLCLEGRSAVTPLARIIQTWPEPHAAGGIAGPPPQVSRAVFVDLSASDSAAIARYVLRRIRDRTG